MHILFYILYLRFWFNWALSGFKFRSGEAGVEWPSDDVATSRWGSRMDRSGEAGAEWPFDADEVAASRWLSHREALHSALLHMVFGRARRYTGSTCGQDLGSREAEDEEEERQRKRNELDHIREDDEAEHLAELDGETSALEEDFGEAEDEEEERPWERNELTQREKDGPGRMGCDVFFRRRLRLFSS